MRIVTTISCILLLLTSMSKAAPPDWYTSGQHPQYQSEFYFVGVGAGDSYDTAMEQASAQLARQIEVQIEAEAKGVVSSYAEEDREVISSEYEAVTRLVSKASLTGAQVSEKAQAGNTYYVLMTIDKDKYTSGLRAELDQMRVEIQQRYDDANALLNEGKVLQGFQVLIETTDVAAEFHARAALYTSLSGNPYLTGDVISGPALLSKVRKLIGKVKLEKISGDDQAAQRGKMLPEPLVLRAVIKQGGGETPVKGLRLALKDAENKALEKTFTGEDGVARFWACAFGEDNGKLYVEVDMQNIPNILRRDFRGVQINFGYDIIPIPPMAFTVQIRDETGKRVSLVEDLISQSVQDAGHHVSDDAPFLISGTLLRSDVQKVEGLNGAQFLVDTGLMLFIQEKTSGTKIGSLKVTGKGMDENSEQAALEKSHMRLKIPKNELIQALSGAADKLKPIQARLSKEALIQGKQLYSAGDYETALTKLAEVTEGEAEAAEAAQLIGEIKLKLLEKSTKNAGEKVETRE
jgi:hypothetical protein